MQDSQLPEDNRLSLDEEIRLENLRHKNRLDLARYQEELELSRHEWLSSTHFTFHAFNAAITYSHNAIKALFIVNGGAIIAILTFIGNYMGADNKSSLENQPFGHYISGLEMFSFGIGFATLTSLASYLTQISYVELRNADFTPKKVGGFLRIFSMIFAALSFMFFCFGIIYCIKAFNSLYSTYSIIL